MARLENRKSVAPRLALTRSRWARILCHGPDCATAYALKYSMRRSSGLDHAVFHCRREREGRWGRPAPAPHAAVYGLFAKPSLIREQSLMLRRAQPRYLLRRKARWRSTASARRSPSLQKRHHSWQCRRPAPIIEGASPRSAEMFGGSGNERRWAARAGGGPALQRSTACRATAAGFTARHGTGHVRDIRVIRAGPGSHQYQYPD